MPAKFLMSWMPRERRWKKMHRGKVYVVSCRHLGTPETKEGSWKEANEWWAATKAEAEKPAEDGRVTKAVAMARAVRGFEDLDDEGRRQVLDSILGGGSYQRLLAQSDATTSGAKALQSDRSIEAHVETWRSLLLSACESGQISAGRYEAYLANVAKFVQWIGPKALIDSIDESKIEKFYAILSAKVAEGAYAPSTAHGIFMTAKQFIRWMAEKKLIQLPGNIDSRRLRFNQGQASKIETFTIDEIRAILAACDEFSEKVKLYVLLMLGGGMYQMDIAELKQDEVDWENGLITRARTKTRNQGGPVVTYKLWKETFSLLKKYRNKKSPLVLTTGEGNPLARRWVESGKTKRYDLIGSAWERLAKRMGMAKHRLGMKHLRKTGASILAEHPQYKYYAGIYLAHAPQSVGDKSYVVPSESEFAEALDWLRVQVLGPEGG
ncbi:MAG: tyrosine-type recombinase/integrase [Candidatus Pacebacteria bacterium]|nr:tyrosine-type recombinase/integrase [Candidatus Paceibacterota bacterium]